MQQIFIEFFNWTRIRTIVFDSQKFSDCSSLGCNANADFFFQNELCHMIVDCCAQLRTYERFYGLLAERFCKLRKEFQECFERIARDTYHAIHRFEITKLRNMSKLIAHLLATDAISWDVLSEIRLTETDTTSSGRIYIKYLFEELVQIMSEVKVYERTTDP